MLGNLLLSQQASLLDIKFDISFLREVSFAGYGFLRQLSLWNVQFCAVTQAGGSKFLFLANFSTFFVFREENYNNNE